MPDIKYYSIQLSSHDDGWDGFPADANPYVAEGIRCLFGYSFLFTPSIPIFFAGEECKADYQPVPNLAPDLFGKGTEGEGRWLYGSWIQWDQLQQKEHAQMLEDVRKMIRIRKENSDLFFAWTDNKMVASGSEETSKDFTKMSFRTGASYVLTDFFTACVNWTRTSGDTRQLISPHPPWHRINNDADHAKKDKNSQACIDDPLCTGCCHKHLRDEQIS